MGRGEALLFLRVMASVLLDSLSVNAAFYLEKERNCKSGSLAEERKSFPTWARSVITPARGKKKTGLEPWRQQITLRAFNLSLKK